MRGVEVGVRHGAIPVRGLATKAYRPHILQLPEPTPLKRVMGKMRNILMYKTSTTDGTKPGQSGYFT